MGLLDELKHQADSELLKQRATQENRLEKLQASHARMKSALQYWVDFVKALNVVKPPVMRNYWIEGTTQLEGLLQCDYNVNSRRVTYEHHDYLDSIELRFRSMADAKVTVEKESETAVTRLREHLWQHGLKFEAREVRREGVFVERGIFTIVPEVVTGMTIAADVEHDRIRLVVRNLERLGEYTYTYDFDEFGEPLFEEIAKAILGKPHQLRRWGRHQATAGAATHDPERRA